MGDFRELISAALLRILAKLAPGMPDFRACIDNGLKALGNGKHEEALAHFERALRLQPDSAIAHANRGTALYLLGKAEEAIDAYDRAIALDGKFASAYRERGIILGRAGRRESGLESLERAIQLNPLDHLAVFEHGHLLLLMSRVAEAEAQMDRAIALKFDYAPALATKAICRLVMGDLEQGLPLFEWRWTHLGIDPSRGIRGIGLWLGDEPIEGARLLIVAEQGFGDVIQFCRYVPILEQRGAEVMLLVPTQLGRLMRSLSATVTIVEHDKPLPACDFVCPVVSLALAMRTTLESIPGSTPYLSADPALKTKWAERLGVPTRLRVGLSWSGNAVPDPHRSIPIESLRPLLETQAEFHVIQRDTTVADREWLRPFSNVHLHALDDFAETAALVDSMDLVISIDTAAAHLAGALAKPLWILLPFMPDWRWLLERSDTPWYPTARLFRQPAYQDWTPVIEQVRGLLQSRLDEGERPSSRSAGETPRPTEEYRALIQRGLEEMSASRFDEAVKRFDEAIALQPELAVGHANRGAAQARADRPEEALASYERATQLDPTFADALRNQGLILCQLRRYDEGVRLLDRAISVKPRDFDALFGRSGALLQLKRVREALADIDRAIEIDPDHWSARFLKGLWSMMVGDFETGLPLMEWRWKLPGNTSFRVPAGLPVWLGDEPIAGRDVLVLPEQGMGDFIQFCRYAPSLAAIGARVFLATPPPLLRLMRSIGPETTVFDCESASPPFDYACPIGSLPLALKATLETIPSRTPYLHVDQAIQTSWAERIARTAGRLQVGIAWSGNPKNENDRLRSIPLESLRAITEVAADFHAVQLVTPAEREELRSFANVWTHAIEDFADAGAIMNLMDVVISVDTAAAHLAGALARPVWILLPFIPDWRWLLDRDDSPWYPTATLFRQPRLGDWGSVVEDVRARLLSLGRDR